MGMLEYLLEGVVLKIKVITMMLEEKEVKI